jgi:hypothetical protein
MSSLILELQRDALQPDVRLTDLLRKALVVARKLGLGEFEEWVNAELNGYMDRSKIPDYRELSGFPVAYSSQHGWIRLMTYNLDPDQVEMITRFRFDHPISHFEATRDDKNDSIIVAYNLSAERMLTRALHYRGTPALEFHRAQYQGVIDTVRNIILEWTLRLEKDGVLGEGMTFTREEVRKGSDLNLDIHKLMEQAAPTIQIGEFRMDTYNTGQAGAVGPGAHAHDMTFNQIWNQMQGAIDLQKLATELSELRQQMKKEAVEVEQDIAVSDIAKAEQAAKAGDGPKMLEHLKSAGKWGLDVATKIGTSVAAELIKKSMTD